MHKHYYWYINIRRTLIGIKVLVLFRIYKSFSYSQYAGLRAGSLNNNIPCRKIVFNGCHVEYELKGVIRLWRIGWRSESKIALFIPVLIRFMINKNARLLILTVYHTLAKGQSTFGHMGSSKSAGITGVDSSFPRRSAERISSSATHTCS